MTMTMTTLLSALSWLAETARSPKVLTALLAGFALAVRLFQLSSAKAKKRLLHLSDYENILVVGASSGVGEATALQYAKSRGNKARLCLVARRDCVHLVQAVQKEGGAAWSVQADATQAADVLRLQAAIADKWGRLDTMIICAGALTVQPILRVTKQATAPSPRQVTQLASSPSLESLSSLSELAQQSYSANVLPSLLLVSALLPNLLKSPCPRICILSSVAAEIPAPTRALYGAHKAALSMLWRSLRIELENVVISSTHDRKSIGVTLIHPASIDTGLRTSALDSHSFEAKGDEESSTSKRKAMSTQYVAMKTIEAIDGEKDEVWLPESYWWISKFGQIFLPGFVKQGAIKKYGYQ